jgi:hypothetical protein
MAILGEFQTHLNGAANKDARVLAGNKIPDLQTIHKHCNET